MCNNCAFSENDRAHKCLECEICLRNPTNLSFKFKPTEYKGRLIEKPIDMYISKELMAIMLEEIKKAYLEGMNRAQSKPVPYIPWSPPDLGRSGWPHGLRWKQNLFKVTASSGNTLSVTYTVSIPTSVPIPEPIPLPISEKLGEVKTIEKKENKVIKTVCINVIELLKELDGVEVSEAV